MKKEKWNSSDKAAEKLKISDFGNIDQIKDMAKMENKIDTYNQAREFLSSLVGQQLISRSGLRAVISKKSIEKILSTKSVDNSYNYKVHLLAAGNIDKLYSNAIEPWIFEMNPNRNNDSLLSIHRLFAPIEFDEQIAIVKITVKRMKNPKDGNRIYTIKALDVFLEIKK